MVTFSRIVLYASLVSGAVFWVIPPALRLLVNPVQDLIGSAAALILWPEYVSTTMRRSRGERPSSLAYSAGDLVGWIAGFGQVAVARVLVGVSRGLGGLPSIVVVVVSTAGVAGLVMSSR